MICDGFKMGAKQSKSSASAKTDERSVKKRQSSLQRAAHKKNKSISLQKSRFKYVLDTLQSTNSFLTTDNRVDQRTENAEQTMRGGIKKSNLKKESECSADDGVQYMHVTLAEDENIAVDGVEEEDTMNAVQVPMLTVQKTSSFFGWKGAGTARKKGKPPPPPPPFSLSEYKVYLYL